jgi:hypothetical protein
VSACSASVFPVSVYPVSVYPVFVHLVSVYPASVLPVSVSSASVSSMPGIHLFFIGSETVLCHGRNRPHSGQARFNSLASLYHILEKKKQENVMLYKIKYNWYENGIDKGE